ncbi:MAG: hypothetical protein LBD23_05610 [Oscillospiraceae bacterium]|jgi:hypothetical protein|nr:hypothetical protein [Oscillospiraceae bacterium]
MSEIFEIIDRFWGIAGNKAISLVIIVLAMLGLAFYKFKEIRHPRYRYRVVFVVLLLLLNVCLYLDGVLNFEWWHLYIISFEILLLTFVVLSLFKPTLAFFPLKRAESLVEDGNTIKAKKWLNICNLIAFTAVSRHRYHLVLSDFHAQKRRYIKAYGILRNVSKKNLFQEEIDNLEIHMAHYLIYMGSMRAAKRHIDKVEKKVPLLLILESNIEDACGASAIVVFDKIKEANDLIGTKTDDYVKAQIYANFSSCRKAQGNFSDAVFYARKAAECAKKSKSDLLIFRTFEMLITLLRDGNDDNNADKVYKELLILLDTNKQNNFFRVYNFMLKEHRRTNKSPISVIPLIRTFYETQIKTLVSLEKYNFEVSMLDVALEAGITITAMMFDVMKDFNDYFKVEMPDRYNLIHRVHCVLDTLFNNTVVEPIFEKPYMKIFEQCEKYLAECGEDDLQQYYDTFDEHQVYERGHILKSMVLVSTFREWYHENCIRRFDKALGHGHCYNNIEKSGHKKRIELLIDILDMYNHNNLTPSSISAYSDVIDECYSVYWVQANKTYEINIIDREIMEKYVQQLVDLIETSTENKRYELKFLKIASYYCILCDFEKANRYFKLFNSNEKHRFNRWYLHNYEFVKSVLEAQPKQGLIKFLKDN